MLVDMNSFFASVEQQANPYLRGKPVGVCASLHETSCIIGTSKELKAMGIKNGFPTYLAKKICPEVVLVQSEPEKYREVNRQIVRIFQDYTDRLEVYSIDEAFLEIPNNKVQILNKFQNSKFKIQNPLLIGAEIKKRIREEVGEWLTCSVGIGHNKFLCKLAADLEKPDGLTVIWRENLPEIYKSKKLTDLWGINHGWANRLAKLGIFNPGQLLGYPVQKLISVFGKPGFYIWQRVNGLEEDEIPSSFTFDGDAARGDMRSALGVTQTALRQTIRAAPPNNDLPKSFGHSWVLNFRTTDKDRLKIVILRLAEKAARRMRQAGFVASEIYLSVRLIDGNGMHCSKRLGFQLETGWQLYEEALKIWQNWQFPADVMHIAVGFTGLKLKSNQLSLFPEKFDNLIPTLDQINDRYGEFTIRPGLLTATQDYAPDAIAFGR
ncbi:MAG: hypothetical protein A3B10_04035 [Candidatus Doudnabacteria bacterium RIFCSPLOWO2_01_FULL_44_21]|uniref:UmuC domain-containing protein n=1 Tax=Candidatus Doudnabacteria bacterium RIFCSPLOWO2_01_FULL_44_21 TaxID=1817841 RepID=A0A1F5Q554_9BACT|nr:MAG: hypothetical protein A3B10_04035 [Candidatus Doudnabacteria bacterium RIFCSPLOWO2_01_FULL_44_21]